MVAGHAHAHAVSLVRWGALGLRGRDFMALLIAIAQVRGPAQWGTHPLGSALHRKHVHPRVCHRVSSCVYMHTGS